MRIFGFLLLVFLHGAGLAQTKQVTGVVRDPADGTTKLKITLSEGGNVTNHFL